MRLGTQLALLNQLRATCYLKQRNLIHHRVDRLEFQNLALTSTVIFLDKPPFATAVVTSAIFRTWANKLPAMKLTGKILPGASNTFNFRLNAQLSF